MGHSGMSAESLQGVTQELAAFAAQVSWDDLPTDVRDRTALILLDSLGCIVAAYDAPATTMTVRAARALGPGPAAIIGSDVRCGILGAALANGMLTYALDFEPVGPEGHVCAATVPSAVTLGAALGCSGRDVLLALAVGLEVGGRVGVGVRRTRQGHDQPQRVRGNNHAIFGAVAAAGRLLGLSDSAMAHAFGIAGYSAPPPTLTRCMANPPVPDVKYDHLGVCAQLGIQAALLASEGLTGDTSILDGETGFWTFTGAQECQWASMTAGLGHRWILPQTWFKAYPNSLYAAPAVDAMLGVLHETGLDPSEIEHIRVFNRASTAVSRDTRPRTPSSAGLSLPCNLACAALRISPRRRWHDPSVYTHPDILRLAERVELVPLPSDPAPPLAPWEGWAPVEVEIAARGQTFRSRRERLRQLTLEEVIAKFHENVNGLIPASLAEKVVGQVRQLEQVDRLVDLLALLQVQR